MVIEIPEMIDPLGRYWDQPDRGDIIIDGDYAGMEIKTFNRLAHYAITNPTGAYPGKMWRRGKWLCFYAIDPNDSNYLLIVTKFILIV